jgi:hypothetical protein
LPRSCILGRVEVVDIVSKTASEWLGGPMGLVPARPKPCEPIPAAGVSGCFESAKGGDPAPSQPWMALWNRPSGNAETAELSPDLAPSFRTLTERPRRKR